MRVAFADMLLFVVTATWTLAILVNIVQDIRCDISITFFQVVFRNIAVLALKKCESIYHFLNMLLFDFFAEILFFSCTQCMKKETQPKFNEILMN